MKRPFSAAICVATDVQSVPIHGAIGLESQAVWSISWSNKSVAVPGDMAWNQYWHWIQSVLEINACQYPFYSPAILGAKAMQTGGDTCSHWRAISADTWSNRSITQQIFHTFNKMQMYFGFPIFVFLGANYVSPGNEHRQSQTNEPISYDGLRKRGLSLTLDKCIYKIALLILKWSFDIFPYSCAVSLKFWDMNVFYEISDYMGKRNSYNIIEILLASQ